MLFVNYKIDADRELLLSNIMNNDLVVSEENYDTANGKPKMHIKSKGNRLKIKCEMTERPTKDNAFLEGTYFLGSLTQKGQSSRIRGLIMTAPIYHSIFLALLVVVICQAIIVKGIPVTAIFLVLFDLMMFKGEFGKQSLIKRYIFRALKITYRINSNKRKDT
ncbi:MAG: hypothetical protein IJX92_00230 [Clostridia bacterium]|nr:hypothetical protein [Clostridia bacterium]